MGNVNARVWHGIPGSPVNVAAACLGGKNGLADEERRGDSAGNNFRLKM
jgi:hypothetical protein